MTLSDEALDALLKRLPLANTRRAGCELTRRAAQEEWSYRDFLALLVAEEIATARRRGRSSAGAGLSKGRQSVNRSGVTSVAMPHTHPASPSARMKSSPRSAKASLTGS